MPSRPESVQDSSPKSFRAGEIDEDSAVGRDEDAAGRASVSSSGSSGTTKERRREQRRDSIGAESSRLSEEPESKRPRGPEDEVPPPPRLRLNASLATDPALRPQTVAALINKADPLSPAALQNGELSLLQFFS